MYYVNPIIKGFTRTNQPEGRSGYIRLDQNENPDGLPKWLFDEAMKDITPEFLSLYPEEIIVREKYADMIGVDSGNVCFTAGSVTAMGYLFKVFGEKGKKLICATPTFGMYKVYADMQEMNTVFLHYEDDYSFDVRKMLDVIDDNTGIVSIVNPSMPIGNVYEDNDIRKIVEKARKHDALVIIDEAYYYFYDKTSINLLNEFDNIVILRTFSKLFSIPGLRLGVVISNEQIVQYVNNYKPHYTVNNVAIKFAEVIVDNKDRVISELLEKFNNGKEYLLKQLDANNYSYIPTHGCFICITPKYRTAEEITEKLKERNILIFLGKGDSAGFLRVTIWDEKYMRLFMEGLLDIDTKK